MTIFSDIITLLIQDTDADQSDNLAVKLLSIKAYKFYVHNDVFFKVVRLSQLVFDSKLNFYLHVFQYYNQLFSV